MDINKALEELERYQRPGKKRKKTVGVVLPFTKGDEKFWCAYYEFDQPSLGDMEILSYTKGKEESVEMIKKAEGLWKESYEDFEEGLKSSEKYNGKASKFNAMASGITAAVFEGGGYIAGAAAAVTAISVFTLLPAIGFGGAFAYVAVANYRNKRKARKALEMIEEIGEPENEFTLTKHKVGKKIKDPLVYRAAKRMLVELKDNNIDGECFREYRDMVKAYEKKKGWEASLGTVVSEKKLAKKNKGGKTRLDSTAYHIDGVIDHIMKKVAGGKLKFSSPEEEELFKAGAQTSADAAGVAEAYKGGSKKATIGARAWEKYHETLESYPRKEEVEGLKLMVEVLDSKGKVFGAKVGGKKQKEEMLLSMEQQLFGMEESYNEGEMLKTKYRHGYSSGGFMSIFFGLPFTIINWTMNGYQLLKKYGDKTSLSRPSKKKTAKTAKKKKQKGFRAKFKGGLSFIYDKLMYGDD